MWNDVTTNKIHRSDRGLQSGTSWKTAKAVIGVDGNTYVQVSTNEYANINQMDLQNETSKQDLSGVVHVGNNTQLYSNPLEGAKPISNRALAANTDWKTDGKVTVNGVTYYRVSTDEWVKAEDSNLISETSRSDKTYIANDPDAEPLPDTDTDTDNNNNGSGDNNGGGTTTPTETKAPVTIKYVDDQGKTIASAPDKTTEGTVGQTYTLTDADKTVEGYTYVSADNDGKEITKDGLTITVTLKADTPEVTTADVTLHYTDENGATIDGLSDKKVSGDIGKTYT
ncbi:MucBP domain-containing protein, partial [Companilactobacillus tucceti]